MRQILTTLTAASVLALTGCANQPASHVLCAQRCSNPNASPDPACHQRRGSGCIEQRPDRGKRGRG